MAKREARERAGKWLLGRVWVWRRGLAPVAFSFSLWLAGFLAHSADDGVRTVVASLLVLGVALGWWMSRPKPKKTRNVQTYVWLLYLFCFGWLIAAGLVGVWPGTPATGTMCALLIVAFMTFSPFWWYRYHVRSMPEGKEIKIWEEFIACPGGALPGSRLIEVKHTKDGWTATVVLQGGLQDSESALVAQKRIASAYASAYGKKQSISLAAVTLEEADDQRADLLKLSVFKDNPTHQKLLYSEDLYELLEGCVPMCRFPDRRWGYARLFEPRSGTYPVVIAGDIGSGKSRTVDVFLTQSNKTGLVHTWFIDPQGGNSSAAWAGEEGKAKFVARTHEQALRALQAVERVMYARSAENSKMVWFKKNGRRMVGKDFFEPTPERPILQVVMEEAPALLHKDSDPEFRRIAEAIALMGRKCGIQLVLIAQWPGLDQLGGSNALRTQLKSGTIICMRIGEDMGGDLLLPAHIRRTANPARVPKRFPNGQKSAGTCVLDSSAPDSSRAVYGRVFSMEDEDEESTSAEWAEIVSELAPELERAAWEAAGADFQHYRQHGRWPDAGSGGVRMDKGPAGPSPQPGGYGPQQSASDRILELLSDPARVAQYGVEGKVKLATLATAIKAERNTVGNALKRLQDKGVVASDAAGYYWLTRETVQV